MPALKPNQVQEILWRFGQDPLKVLQACDGFYEQPNPSSPLVAYAGTYEADGEKKHYVGRIYANFAKTDEYQEITRHFAEGLFEKFPLSGTLRACNCVCGMPLGGLGIGRWLAYVGHMRFICPEKKVTKVGTRDSKEESKLAWGRHTPDPEDLVIIAEDVCTKFSTTQSAIELIEATGARVEGVACLLNRSMDFDQEFQFRQFEKSRAFPIVALVRKPYADYKQEDPEVAEHIRTENVVWNPKRTPEWQWLMSEMQKHGKGLDKGLD